MNALRLVPIPATPLPSGARRAAANAARRSAPALLLWLAALATLVALVALGGLIAPAAALAADDAGRALAEHGQWKQLRDRVTPRVQADPNDAEAAWLLSQVKQAFGDPPGAVALAEKAVKLEPTNAAYHLQLAETVGQSAQKAGPIKGLGLAKRFRKEAEAAIALDPRQIDARVDLMMFHLVAPGIAGGDKKKAAALSEEIARLNPARGELARARLALQQKDTTRAEAAYRKAAELGASNRDVLTSAASFLASRRAWAEAEKYARAAIALDPRGAGPYGVLALVLVQQARWADLDATLAAAEAANPGNLGATYQAGRALIERKADPARAERYMRRYLAVEPEGGTPGWGGAHWRLGNALEQQGKRDEALAELETAFRLKPDLDPAAKRDLDRLRKDKAVAKRP